jgi:hypothetical protein
LSLLQFLRGLFDPLLYLYYAFLNALKHIIHLFTIIL